MIGIKAAGKLEVNKDKCIIVCCFFLLHDVLLPSFRPLNIRNCKFCTKITIKYQNSIILLLKDEKEPSLSIRWNIIFTESALYSNELR